MAADLSVVFQIPTSVKFSRIRMRSCCAGSRVLIDGQFGRRAKSFLSLRQLWDHRSYHRRLVRPTI